MNIKRTNCTIATSLYTVYFTNTVIGQLLIFNWCFVCLLLNENQKTIDNESDSYNSYSIGLEHTVGYTGWRKKRGHPI